MIDHHAESMKLDCTLLVLAGLGVYVYGMFSILGSFFAVQDDLPGMFFRYLNYLIYHVIVARFKSFEFSPPDGVVFNRF